LIIAYLYEWIEVVRNIGKVELFLQHKISIRGSTIIKENRNVE